MTQEEKDILINDLSARLPYGVLVDVEGYWMGPLKGLSFHEGKCIASVGFDAKGNPREFDIALVKPLLRPWSDLTNEEILEIMEIKLNHSILDYMNAHRLDYRGLIEKDLALKGSAQMYEQFIGWSNK